jgi:hypothetical protein
MKTIHLKVGGGAMNLEIDTVGRGGKLTSDGLKACCPTCEKPDCYFILCQGGHLFDLHTDDETESRDDIEARRIFNAAVDGVESLILAAACQGIDVETEAFRNAVQTALDAVGNSYGD